MKGWHKEKRYGQYDHLARMQARQAREREHRLFQQIAYAMGIFTDNPQRALGLITKKKG